TEWQTYGYGPPLAAPTYRIYLKDTEFVRPGAASLWVFVDEHPDSINDGLFGMHMPLPKTLWPGGTVPWDDVPASYHNGACGFSFADGHGEIHKWLDANTKAPIRKVNPASTSG